MPWDRGPSGEKGTGPATDLRSTHVKLLCPGKNLCFGRSRGVFPQADRSVVPATVFSFESDRSIALEGNW
jgi:hypothetical protein